MAESNSAASATAAGTEARRLRREVRIWDGRVARMESALASMRLDLDDAYRDGVDWRGRDATQCELALAVGQDELAGMKAKRDAAVDVALAAADTLDTP